jgi:hypothetical protein
MNLLTQALFYAGAGISVFPVTDQKTPYTEHGFKDATTDREQIEAWWRQWPDAGIATPDFDVVDVDLYKPGAFKDWQQIKSLIPPATPQTKTPRGGLQFFFQPGSLTARKFADAIDLRYAGRNYVLLPPSAFADYGRYEFIAKLVGARLQPAPAFPSSSRTGPAPPIGDKIPYGRQHYELVSLAGSMRRRGMNADEIYAALTVVNETRCERPGPDENIRRIADSVSQYKPASGAHNATAQSSDADGRHLDELVDSRRQLELRIVPLAEFTDVDEPGAEAILGTTDSAVIPEGGDAMVYGDGGVGKTTLMIDLACHLAAGDDWLGLTVPRPFRILIVENEGPRPLFRRKLARKQTAWKGSPLGDRVHILEEPWGELDLCDSAWRDALAAAVSALEIDVIIAGPLTSIGMEGAGTISETRAFLSLVKDVRDRSGRPIASVIVHHENRAGKVSGAWEGTGDTLLHVQQQGHGKVRLYFQKARWASEQHATALQLRWGEGDAFEIAEPDSANRPLEAWLAIEKFVKENHGCTWNKVAAAKDEDGKPLVRGGALWKQRRRDAMLEEGILINAGTAGAFELWHRDDPMRPHVLADEEQVIRTGESPDESG